MCGMGADASSSSEACDGVNALVYGSSNTVLADGGVIVDKEMERTPIDTDTGVTLASIPA